MWRMSDILNLSFTTCPLAPLVLDAAMSMKQRKRESKIGPNIFPMSWPCSPVNETPWKLDSVHHTNQHTFLFLWERARETVERKTRYDFFYYISKNPIFFLHTYTFNYSHSFLI